MAERPVFPGNGASRTPIYSPDGTKIYFQSDATNIVAGDTNAATDIFKKDLTTGTIRRVSTTATGEQADGASSLSFVVSADGTKLAFESRATNLSANDVNGADDVFVKDLTTGSVTLVSTTPTGGTGDGMSYFPALSPDGTKVAFVSFARDLTADSPTGERNLFIRNLTTGAVTQENTPVDGTSGTPDQVLQPIFSPDGNKIMYNATFGDQDTTTVIKDLNTGQSDFLLPPENQRTYLYSIDAKFSPDGSKIVFRSAQDDFVEGDDNRSDDIFVKDLASGNISIVSANVDGDVGNGDSGGASFSPDGSKVVFSSFSSNLVEGDDNGVSDVFVKDLASGEIVRVSVGPDGTGISGDSGAGGGVFSPDGTKVAFGTGRSFVVNDTNRTNDIYIKDLTTGEITLASTATQPPCYCTGTSIRTPGGDVPVERLRIGDPVVTADGAHRPIRWIGTRAYAPRFANTNPDLLPVRIVAGALADGIPGRDLHVSPKHAMVLDGLLVPAELLVNGVSITRATRVTEELTYWHVELDSHDVLIAEGAHAESFLNEDSRGLFHNAASYRAMYPEAQDGAGVYCLPRVEDGYALETIRRRLRARAGLPVAAPTMGRLDGAFSVAEDGVLSGWARDAAHPEVPVILDVFVGSRHVAQLCADEGEAGGFSLPLPVQGGAVSVRRSGDGAPLACLAQAA